jgi:hypothetical protein
MNPPPAAEKPLADDAITPNERDESDESALQRGCVRVSVAMWVATS